ncbi:DUF412 family protein [Sneathiella sedimenti]
MVSALYPALPIQGIFWLTRRAQQCLRRKMILLNFSIRLHMRPSIWRN